MRAAIKWDVRFEHAQTQPSCIYVLIKVYIPTDGYVDNVYVCVKALKKLQEINGIEKLEKLWDCDEELDEVMDHSYPLKDRKQNEEEY